MKKNNEGILKDWGEALEPPKIKGRKGKNIRGGKTNNSSSKQKTSGGGGGRAKLERTVNNAPEVMVKISGGGKNMKHIQAHMDYISRNGDIEVEDENGHTHNGKDEVNEIADSWANGRITIPWKSEKRKEAFNIILSMPPGTDREAVKNAAREFAKEEFKEHQYLFAAHNDENHPHVHLTVKATSNHGVRLNPRKADLQHWREQFAEKLRDNGIEANATPRRFRGIVKKHQKQAIKHIDKDYKSGKRKEPSKATQAQIEAVKKEIETGQKHRNDVSTLFRTHF